MKILITHTQNTGHRQRDSVEATTADGQRLGRAACLSNIWAGNVVDMLARTALACGAEVMVTTVPTDQDGAPMPHRAATTPFAK